MISASPLQGLRLFIFYVNSETEQADVYMSIEVNYMKVINAMQFLCQYCSEAIVRRNDDEPIFPSYNLILPRSGLNFPWNSHWAMIHFAVKVANKQTFRILIQSKVKMLRKTLKADTENIK